MNEWNLVKIWTIVQYFVDKEESSKQYTSYQTIHEYSKNNENKKGNTFNTEKGFEFLVFLPLVI